MGGRTHIIIITVFAIASFVILFVWPKSHSSEDSAAIMMDSKPKAERSTSRAELVEEDLEKTALFIARRLTASTDSEATDQLAQTLKSVTETKRIKQLYSNVSGPIDRWWREEKWLARAAIRYLITPTQLRLLIYRGRIESLRNELEALQEFSHTLQTPDVILALANQLTARKCLEAVKDSRPYEADIALAFAELGTDLSLAYEAGGGEDAIITRLQSNCHKRLQQVTERSLQDNPAFPKLLTTPSAINPTDLGRDLALDRLITATIMIQSLCDAKLKAIDKVERFFDEKVSSVRVDEFYEDLIGPWDTLAVAWKSRGTTKLERTLEDMLRSKVLSEQDLNELTASVRQEYELALNYAAARVFDEVRAAPNSYPEVQNLLNKIDSGNLNQVDLGDGLFLRTQILGGAFELPLLAGDVTLIVVGILGAPESAGISLILSVAGVAHMTIDATIQLVAVSKHDIRTTSIRCVIQSMLAATYLGTDGKTATIGEAPILLDAQQANAGVISILDQEFLKQMHMFVSKVLGTQQ